MKNRSVFLSIIMLAWPTILEQAMQTAVSYIDYAMVGSVGTEAIAAIGVTNTVNWLVNSPLWACGAAFLACIARCVGAGQREMTHRYAAQAVTVSVALGFGLMLVVETLTPYIPGWMGAQPEISRNAVMYFAIISSALVFRAIIAVASGVLRGAGDTRTPMFVNVTLNLVNLVLNYLFIYETHTVRIFGAEITVWGAGMGVVGAGIATAIAFTYGGVAIMVALIRHPDVTPRGQSFRPDKEILRPAFKIAVPAIFQRLVACSGQVVFSSMVNSLGTVAVTAHSTAITAESAFYIPGYGMQAAASALEGQAYGAGDRQRMRKLAGTLLVIVFFVMSITGTLLFILAENIMGFFSSDPEVIALGAKVLRMVAISEPVYGVAIILEGIFYGIGDTIHPFWFEAIGMWCIRILGTFITVKIMGFGLTAAWACMIAHNAGLAAMMTVHYRRSFRKQFG